MTEAEKREIVDGVLQEIMKPKGYNSKCMAPVWREYKFKVADRLDEGQSMYDAYVIWDCVRKTSLKIYGVNYVTQVKDVERARRIARTLLDTVIEVLDAQKGA